MKNKWVETGINVSSKIVKNKLYEWGLNTKKKLKPAKQESKTTEVLKEEIMEYE